MGPEGSREERDQALCQSRFESLGAPTSYTGREFVSNFGSYCGHPSIFGMFNILSMVLDHLDSISGVGS